MFSQSLYVSTQFIKTTVENPHLLGSPKHSKQLMMVRWHSEEGEPFWMATLLTVQEAQSLEKMLKTKENNTNADFVLVRPNRKIVASAASVKHGETDLPGLFALDGEQNALMMQALFLNGDLKSLDDPVLYSEFVYWLQSHKEMARTFFEEEILNKQPGCETTNAYKALYR